MPYLNLDLDFLEHPKIQRLIARFGANAVVMLIRLWTFAAKYHPKDGNLSQYTIQEIEGFSGWSGDGGYFVDACIEIGLIDSNAKRKIVLHDWSKHQGHLRMYKERAEAASKVRWDRISPNRIKRKRVTRNATSNAPSNAKEGSKQCLADATSNALLYSTLICSALENYSKKNNLITSNLSDVVTDLAEYLLKRILENKPDRDISDSWMNKTLKQINLMIRKNKRDPEKIREVIDWCQSDTEPRGTNGFCWVFNILSGASLRKQFDRLQDDMKRVPEKEPSFDQMLEKINEDVDYESDP